MLTGFFIYTAGKTNITVTDSCAIYLPLFPFSLIIFIKAYFKCIFTTMIPIVGAVKYVYINETQVLGLFILITKKKKVKIICSFIFLTTIILKRLIWTHPFWTLHFIPFYEKRPLKWHAHGILLLREKILKAKEKYLNNIRHVYFSEST